MLHKLILFCNFLMKIGKHGDFLGTWNFFWFSWHKNWFILSIILFLYEEQKKSYFLFVFKCIHTFYYINSKKTNIQRIKTKKSAHCWTFQQEQCYLKCKQKNVLKKIFLKNIKTSIFFGLSVISSSFTMLLYSLTCIYLLLNIRQ